MGAASAAWEREEVSFDSGCSVDEPGGPWALLRDETAIPSTDTTTVALIEEAVGSLVSSRCPLGGRDAGAALSCLVSLIGEAESRLSDAVADAKGQGYTWEQIGGRMATSASAARHRYASYVRWRRSVGLDAELRFCPRFATAEREGTCSSSGC